MPTNWPRATWEYNYSYKGNRIRVYACAADSRAASVTAKLTAAFCSRRFAS